MLEKDRQIPLINGNYIRRRGEIAIRSSQISDTTTLMASRNFNEQLDKSCEPDRQEVPVPRNLSVTFTYAATFSGIPAGRYRLPRPRNVSLCGGGYLIGRRPVFTRTRFLRNRDDKETANEENNGESAAKTRRNPASVSPKKEKKNRKRVHRN